MEQVASLSNLALIIYMKDTSLYQVLVMLSSPRELHLTREGEEGLSGTVRPCGYTYKCRSQRHRHVLSIETCCMEEQRLESPAGKNSCSK